LGGETPDLPLKKFRRKLDEKGQPTKSKKMKSPGEGKPLQGPRGKERKGGDSWL